MPIATVVTPHGQYLYDNYHFADAVQHGDLLICSGVLGTADNGRAPDAIEQEFDLAWGKVMALLEHAGTGAAHILEYTSYHIDLRAHMAAFMAARDRVLSAPWPAWTAIGIVELAVPGAHVEIRVIARIP